MYSKKLEDYKNIHSGETFIVMGLGESLNLLPKELLYQYNTIGVNDIERLKIYPDHLLFCDVFRNMDKKEFDTNNNRVQHIESSICENIFTRRINFNRMADAESCIDITDKWRPVQDCIDGKSHYEYGKYLYSSVISPFMACSLAIYMGAARIFLIGVDLVGNHAFDARNKNNMFETATKKSIIEINFSFLVAMHPTVEIYNISPISRLFSLPKKKLFNYDERMLIND